MELAGIPTREHPDLAPTFENFEAILKELYKNYTFEFAAQESGVDSRVIEEIAELVAKRAPALDPHLAKRNSRQPGRVASFTVTLFVQRIAWRHRYRRRDLSKRVE